MGSHPRNLSEQKQYHDFLDTMNEERSRRNALGKMKDYQEGKKVSNRHIRFEIGFNSYYSFNVVCLW